MQKRGKFEHKPHTDLDKAQAALEFLMTYGWAILVVSVAISALSYFGVLSPDIVLRDKCSLLFGLECLDYGVTTTKVTLSLQNTLGEDITIDKIDVTKENGNLCSTTKSLSLKNGEKATAIIANCEVGNAGQKFKGDIKIMYKLKSLASYSTRGSIRAKISEESTTTSFTDCQTMDDDGLCEGLDMLFGEGYRAACCSEHGLCC